MYKNYHKHDHHGNPWVMDVVVKPEEYCKRAIELGHDTVFTVNHGVTGNIFEWLELSKKYNLKMCYGTEAYYVNDFEDKMRGKHLIIIAKNNDGVMQLNDISPKAIIGNNVKIGNFSTICEDVVIGDDTVIEPNVVIYPGARIGRKCHIFPGSVISAIPQDLKFAGEYTTCEIGDENVIRECCTINRGTSASGRTVIGSHNLLMAYVHVAHDCVVGNNCVFANNATLAGHIIVGDYVILGGKTACLQFIHIGSHVITQGGALIDKDIPPFVKAARYPISYAGVNSLGLQRRGFSRESINNITDIYRFLFQKGYTISHAVEEIKERYGHTDEGKQVLSFIGNAQTGLMKGYTFMKKDSEK